MRKSESIKHIAEALCKMQANPIVIGVNATGFGYDYATLDKVISRIMPIATSYGLSMAQPLGNVNGEPAIVTLLMHTSGEWFEDSFPLEKAGIGKANDAQQLGAMITYVRRYGALSLYGVAVGKDDDANCLTEEPEPKAKPSITRKKYEADDPTPIESLIKRMGQCVSLFSLDILMGESKHLVEVTGKEDQVNAEYSVCKGKLRGKKKVKR